MLKTQDKKYIYLSFIVIYYEKEGNLIMEIINKLWKLLYSNLIYCSFNIVHDFQNKICDKNKMEKTIF